MAREVFSHAGYAAASMSHIAERLGGSKATLYHYFRSKDELFEAHIRDHCRRYTDAVFGNPLPGGEIANILAALGERILTFSLTDDSIAFYSLVISEAVRNPPIGRVFYESGPRAGARCVADLLDRARAKGQIMADDCIAAATQFMSLIHGGILLQRALNVIPPPSAAEISGEAARLAQSFLRGYAPAAATAAS